MMMEVGWDLCRLGMLKLQPDMAQVEPPLIIPYTPPYTSLLFSHTVVLQKDQCLVLQLPQMTLIKSNQRQKEKLKMTFYIC